MGVATTPVHPSLPIEMKQLTGNITAVQTQLGTTVGTSVQIEVTAAGAIYTVPSGKTFTGVVRIAGSGTGSITVSAATGGVIASLGFDSKGTGAAEVNTVQVAGGAGNAITCAVSGGASIASVALIGHVG